MNHPPQFNVTFERSIKNLTKGTHQTEKLWNEKIFWPH